MLINIIRINFISFYMGIGDWGLGIGDWAQSPIPKGRYNKLLYILNK